MSGKFIPAFAGMTIRIQNCFSGEEQMSILTANLKHLYQRRGLWLVYAFLGSIALPVIMAVIKVAKTGEGVFVYPVIWMFIVGWIAATIQIEIISKPYTYCLPGHRKIVRQFILLVGLTVSLLCSLVFLLYPGLNLWQLLPVILSGFSVFLAFYWFGVIISFSIYSQVRWVGFLPLIFIAGMFFKLQIILETMVIKFPVLFIIIGILISVLAWLWLDEDSIARRYCANPLIGFFGGWDRSKIQRHRQALIAAKGDKAFRTSPHVEQFFLSRIGKHDYTSIGKYVWGGLYTTFGTIQSQSRSGFLGMTFAVLFMLCYFGYIGRMATMMLFIMPGFMVIPIRLPLYSNMLISGGRKERFVTTVTVVGAITVLITAAVAILAALTIPMVNFMPDISLLKLPLTFHAADLRLFFVPLLIIPIVSIFNLIFYRKTIFVIFIMAMLIQVPIMFIAALKRGSSVNQWSSAILNPVSVLVMVVSCWLIFTMVLYYICTKRSLVGQGCA
jgi:hypothetical protein